MARLVFQLIAMSMALHSSIAFSHEYTMGHITLHLVPGHVTTQLADGIVVPHFRTVISQTGVANSLTNLGAGDSLRAAEKILAEIPHNYGDAFITHSDYLSAKILNVVTMGSNEPKKDFLIVMKATQNALKVAADNGLISIAISGSGMVDENSLTTRETANAILAGVYEYLKTGDRQISDVRIAFYKDPETLQEFATVVRKACLLLLLR
jgi:hypothetical protein